MDELTELNDGLTKTDEKCNILDVLVKCATDYP
jgi:hypothetical protein